MNRYVVLLSVVATATLTAVASPAKRSPLIRVTSEPTGRLWATFTVNLHADGYVSVQDYDGTKRTKNIGIAKVGALLNRLEKLGFYRITNESVDNSIQKVTTKTAQGAPAEVERLLITDCDTSTISVRRGAGTHIVKFYGVEQMAEHYPKAADLQILRKALSEVYKAVGVRR